MPGIVSWSRFTNVDVCNIFKNHSGFINSISLQGKANSVGETAAVHIALHRLNFLILDKLVVTTKY